jgi:hypothetical protein
MESIEAILTSFDMSKGLFQEREVADEIRLFFHESNIKDPDSVQLTDLLAFEFMETGRNEESPWNTHYRPHIILSDGTEYPSVNCITQCMVDKWEIRTREFNRGGSLHLDKIFSFLSGISAHAYAASLTIGSSLQYASSGVFLFNLECGRE